MTLVSIKYTRRLPLGLDGLEVGIDINVGNRSQQLSQNAPARARERLGQDLPMFRLGTSAVCASALPPASE